MHNCGCGAQLTGVPVIATLLQIIGFNKEFVKYSLIGAQVSNLHQKQPVISAMYGNYSYYYFLKCPCIIVCKSLHWLIIMKIVESYV